MKYRIQIFLLTIGIINFSCDKEELTISEEFKGAWEWYSTCGGFAGCLYARDYPNENQYKIIIDDFTIQTIENNGNAAIAYYQINNITTQDNLRIFEIELDDGTIYNAFIGDNFLTKDSESDFTTTYKRVK